MWAIVPKLGHPRYLNESKHLMLNKLAKLLLSRTDTCATHVSATTSRNLCRPRRMRVVPYPTRLLRPSEALLTRGYRRRYQRLEERPDPLGQLLRGARPPSRGVDV